jgi:hypothetical protein
MRRKRMRLGRDELKAEFLQIPFLWSVAYNDINIKISGEMPHRFDVYGSSGSQ